MLDLINVSYDTQIPNNVGLSSDRRVLKGLENWHPDFLNWWRDMGPNGFQDMPVYLRTAVSVEREGWLIGLEQRADALVAAPRRDEKARAQATSVRNAGGRRLGLPSFDD